MNDFVSKPDRKTELEELVKYGQADRKSPGGKKDVQWKGRGCLAGRKLISSVISLHI